MKKKLFSFTMVLTLLFSLLSVPASHPSSVSADSEKARMVAGLVNRERAANGLSYLMYSSDLCRAAEVRASEIAESFSHTRPDGTQCFTVLDEYGLGYYAAGENIAAGQRSAESVMNSWMNSSGHRANILSGNFNCIGVACSYIDGRYYWVQLFAGSGSLSGPILIAEKTDETTTTTTTAKPTTTTTTAKPTTTTAKPTTTTTKPTTTTAKPTTTTAKPTTTTAKPTTTTAKSTTTTAKPTTTTAKPTTTTAKSTATTAKTSASDTQSTASTTMPSGVTVNPSTVPTAPDGTTEAPPAQYDSFLDAFVGWLKTLLDSIVDFFRGLGKQA